MGNPAYRVNPITKDVNGDGAGIVVLSAVVLHFFCINCRRWLCSPHLAANKENEKDGKVICSNDATYFQISFKGNKDA